MLALALIRRQSSWRSVRYRRSGHYLDFHAWGYHWPAFNIADAAILVGATLLVMRSFGRDGRPAKRDRPSLR
nr:signal peptidase II [Afipia birgiae]